MLFHQIKGRGDNFSYIIGDEKTKEAMVVDPSYNTEEIIALIKENSYRLMYIVDTHGHRDHTQGNAQLKSLYGAKIVAHHSSSAAKDLVVGDGEVVRLGDVTVSVLHTPGHSPDSICLLANGRLLTGDTLFVGECGRTDLPGGDSRQMYHSLFEKLMKLPDDVLVYPGHDYGASPNSSIGTERRTNYVLKPSTVDEFVKFMSIP